MLKKNQNNLIRVSHEIDQLKFKKTSISLRFIAVIFTLTSRNVTWFYYRKFDFILKYYLVILFYYIKYYLVTALFSYLFEKDKLIKHAQLTVLRWPLGILKNKNLNLTNIKCSNHISELN